MAGFVKKLDCKIIFIILTALIIISCTGTPQSTATVDANSAINNDLPAPQSASTGNDHLSTINAASLPSSALTKESNSVTFNVSTNEYFFKINGQVTYKYSVSDGEHLSGSGASFNALQARSARGNFFHPSVAGGISVKFGGENKRIVNPWEDGVTYKRINLSLNKDTLITQWRMRYDANSIKDSIDYTYKFYLSGKTLVMNIQVDGGCKYFTGVNLDRCEEAKDARIVVIPYLPLFNILYSDSGYTSMYADWEKTNSSTLEPFPSDPSVLHFSDTSVRFTHTINYYPKSNRQRNLLDETIYLTVSPNIDDVFPNLSGPQAPLKDEAAKKIVLSYGPPYPWLIFPDPGPNGNGYSYKYLDSIKHRGVNDVNVIIKNYQYYGFDHRLPDVLNGVQPNPFNTYKDGDCKDVDAGSKGGEQTLKNLRDDIVQTLDYGFALHEQYVDYYPNSPTYSVHGESYESKMSGINGGAVLNWSNCDPPQAHVFKPSVVQNVCELWSSSQRIGYYHPTWSYLDVHSSINPSVAVDYDAGAEGAGLFRNVVNQYRKLPGILRNSYGGPVQGEGNFHFLYVGYFDDFEGRLTTTNNKIYGYKAPLFVDFDLLKMHDKSVQHGVGHYQSFFSPRNGVDRSSSLNHDEVLTYLCTELAYGHGGLVTKANVFDHSIEQAVLEYNYILPVQMDYANAHPVSILYGDEQVTASEYIRTHPEYDNVNNSSQFMSKVKVTYDNGVIVCVNRNPEESWNIQELGVAGKWFSYHAIVDGKNSLGVGKTNFNSFILPPGNGWVVYDPLRTISNN